MSNYTDAHFAATLLECGPHTATCEECAVTNNTCPNTTIYRSRVYSYFFTLFPSMVEGLKHYNVDAPGALYEADNQEREWKRFWQEYQLWVTGGE